MITLHLTPRRTLREVDCFASIQTELYLLVICEFHAPLSKQRNGTMRLTVEHRNCASSLYLVLRISGFASNQQSDYKSRQWKGTSLNAGWYVCLSECTQVCMHLCIHVDLYTCTYICEYMRVCIHVCMYVCMYISTVVSVQLYLYNRNGDVKSSICGVRLPI